MNDNLNKVAQRYNESQNNLNFISTTINNDNKVSGGSDMQQVSHSYSIYIYIYVYPTILVIFEYNECMD
jgi:hypothetical protein